MYLLGCEAQSAYPVVPLTPGHRISIGMTTVQERVCFGVYAESGLSADADRLLRAIHKSIDELLEFCPERGAADRSARTTTDPALKDVGAKPRPAAAQ